jgi:predicted component of type VI protein secretion system
MTKQDEAKVREIIRDILDKELKSQKKETEKDLKDFISKEIDKLDKKVLTKDDVKDLIVKAFIQQSKFMWEKSNIVTQFIKRV